MSKPGKRQRTRYIVVGTAAALVIIAVLVWVLVIRGSGSSAVTYKAGTAETMTLSSSVSESGNVSLATSSVSPSVTGTVTGLTVKVGNKVAAGQLLYTLENEQLDINVSNAQDSYNSAVAAVNKDWLSVLQAEQDLENLEDQQAGQSTSTTSTSSATSTAHSTTGSPSSSSTSSSSNTVTDLDIQVAEANVTSAKLTYQSAKTQVESAELSLQQANQNAAARKVTAPISGVVTTINVTNGEDTGSSGSGSSSNSSQSSGASGAGSGAGASSSSTGASSSSSSSSGSAAIVITDNSSFTVDLSVAESDIPNVKIGQKSTLTFDALPNLTLTGKVTEIDQSGTNSSGVVSYNVTVTPDISNNQILGGMSVTADIITATRTGVVAVPNSAVKTDTSGNSYVLLYKGASVTPTQQTVTTGLVTDTYTEITSGLSAGTQVVTQTITKSSTSTTSRGGSSILGGSTGRTGTGGSSSRTGTGSGGGFPSGGFPTGG
jgi:macrolide-specific efflux system membrane fusion protein